MKPKLLTLPAIILCVILFCIGAKPGLSTNQEPDLEEILKRSRFEKGFIFHKNDSVEASILVYHRRFQKYAFQYCIVKEHNDSIVLYSPKEISGYSVNNEKYIKHVSGGMQFFIQHRVSGKVNLYSRDRIPSDNKFLFYLKFPNEKEFHVISPFENNIDLAGSKDSKGNPIMILKSNEREELFKKFAEIYFKDCQKVVNMVNSGFYTINDIPAVVQEYNDCFKP
jgi:hypothetical protein